MDSRGTRGEMKSAEEFKKFTDGDDDRIKSKTEAHESYHSRVSQQIDEFMQKVNPKRVESALSSPKDDDSMAEERPGSIMSN